MNCHFISRSCWNAKFVVGIFALATFLSTCTNPFQESAIIDAVPAKTKDLAINWGEMDLDELGSPRLRIVMPLDVIPDDKSKVRTPSCLKLLSPDLELGIGRCIEGIKKDISITAANVFQTCYTAPGYRGIAAKEPFRFPGCKVVRIVGHKFTPNLRLDFEPR